MSKFTHDRITLLGFIYTTCVDPEGCPLAYRVFDTLKRTIAATPALHSRVRFVTLSFEGFGQDIRYTLDRSNGKPRRELSSTAGAMRSRSRCSLAIEA